MEVFERFDFKDMDKGWKDIMMLKGQVPDSFWETNQIDNRFNNYKQLRDKIGEMEDDANDYFNLLFKVKSGITKDEQTIRALVKTAINVPINNGRWDHFRETYIRLLNEAGMQRDVDQDKQQKLEMILKLLQEAKKEMANEYIDPMEIEKEIIQSGKYIKKQEDLSPNVEGALARLHERNFNLQDSINPEGNRQITNEDLGGGGIISPKCPKDYDLMKSKCRCKKKTKKKKKVVKKTKKKKKVVKKTKKKKKVVKKTKKQTKKVDRHLETKKKLAQEIIDLHVSLGKKTGKLTTITQLIKLNVGDLRKDIKRLKQMERTKVRNVKKYVSQV